MLARQRKSCQSEFFFFFYIIEEDDFELSFYTECSRFDTSILSSEESRKHPLDSILVVTKTVLYSSHPL